MAWLLSDAATRITGQVIAVDGGFFQRVAAGQIGAVSDSSAIEYIAAPAHDISAKNTFYANR